MTLKPIRGVSLFVEVVGSGYPLLLMHGGPGADHWSMLPFRRCADQFTLVFYDHRCNGRSEGLSPGSMVAAVGSEVCSSGWTSTVSHGVRHRAGYCR